MSRVAARRPEHPHGRSDLCWSLYYPPVSTDMGACWTVVDLLRGEPHATLWAEVVQTVQTRAGTTPGEVLAWITPKTLSLAVAHAVLKPRRGARVLRP